MQISAMTDADICYGMCRYLRFSLPISLVNYGSSAVKRWQAYKGILVIQSCLS